MASVEFEFIVFEWDDNKNRINKDKHGITFDTALTAFFDENCLMKTDYVEDGEQRWKTLGKIENKVVLFIGHLVFDDELGREVIRIITAREATAHEEKQYYVGY